MSILQPITNAPRCAHAAARAESRIMRQPVANLNLVRFAPRTSRGFQGNTPFPLRQARGELRQCRCSVGHQSKQAERIFARLRARVKVHQQRANHRHVKTRQHAFSAVAESNAKSWRKSSTNGKTTPPANDNDTATQWPTLQRRLPWASASRRDCTYLSSIRIYLPPVICSGQFGNDLRGVFSAMRVFCAIWADGAR